MNIYILVLLVFIGLTQMHGIKGPILREGERERAQDIDNKQQFYVDITNIKKYGTSVYLQMKSFQMV